MPEKFLECVRKKGKVFTVKLPKGKYIHGCKLSAESKAVYGEIKTKKKIKK